MARLEIIGINEKKGFNYQVFLEDIEDIKCLIRLYKAFEEAGMISSKVKKEHSYDIEIKELGCNKEESKNE